MGGPGPELRDLTQEAGALTRSVPTLVLGLMPCGATPDSHWAAGPWCFAGQEDDFPHWEENYTFAPEPLHNAPALAETAARQAQALCADSLPALAASLCSHSEALPAAYWETLLTPWAMVMAQQIVERHLRVRAMTAAWGHLPLRVPLLPVGCTFRFAAEQDVVLHGALGPAFNHWLFSRLLEECWPAAWQREMLPPQHMDCSQNDAGRTRENPLRRLLRQAQLHLPFPRLKGMRISQALRFSLALLHTSRGEDRSLSLSACYGSRATGMTMDLPQAKTLSLFQAALPLSLRKLRHPAQIMPARQARTRAASILAYEDAAYRQRLALWRGRGHRLLWVQHGGNYGQTRLACAAAIVEYSQHAFATWGWRRHDACPGHFIPLPYPQLARLKGQRAAALSRGGTDRLLFVGTEISSVGYRLDSHPTPLQMVDYRRHKACFLAALPHHMQISTLYRPYFPVPGALQDGPWLLSRFPQVHLCTGPLLPQMLSCRLLVLDHHGTTMLEALTADIPCILFWQREAWPLTAEASEQLDILSRAGIWHATPEAAAHAAAAVWSDPEGWWQTPTRQEARRTFCEQYALTIKDREDALWLQTLKNL